MRFCDPSLMPTATPSPSTLARLCEPATVALAPAPRTTAQPCVPVTTAVAASPVASATD